MNMQCAQAVALFSCYLDGAVTGKQMHGVNQHLEQCEACAREYSRLRQTQALLGKIGRKKAPEDLELRLRLAISREVSRRRHLSFEGLRIQMQHVIDAFMVPATAGLVSTVMIFGLLIGFLPPELHANHPDVPLMLYTAPQLQQSEFGTDLESISGDSLVIEAYVDSKGRVQDYRVLSSNDANQQLPTPLKNMLIFTIFRPATAMGRPTAGKAVLSFSKISVRG
jgi:hypothetical protein